MEGMYWDTWRFVSGGDSQVLLCLSQRDPSQREVPMPKKPLLRESGAEGAEGRERHQDRQTAVVHGAEKMKSKRRWKRNYQQTFISKVLICKDWCQNKVRSFHVIHATYDY
ncbi:hypothetical protein ATANTOWER_013074 [Ataeniobius toweri]|uniref:Uncharacterized protein n=1 Tax=Ataeniobius toweri TaxID=208326 RepID=A0ABU7CIN2_9TELE|nr:hypothetical protein [Ataeniobius toweri]